MVTSSGRAEIPPYSTHLPSLCPALGSSGNVHLNQTGLSELDPIDTSHGSKCDWQEQPAVPDSTQSVVLKHVVTVSS